MAEELDSPARIRGIRALIQGKAALRDWYRQCYGRFAISLAAAPRRGRLLELGSGGGFAGEFFPGLISSDLLPYEGLDRVVDARRLPFKAASLRGLLLANVFHHIPDAGKFLAEAQRCLMPGGRLLMVEPHDGLISGLILRYAHHEPFLPDAPGWKFESKGPLSGSNQALAQIVLVRDRAEFERRFPRLQLLRFDPFSPLQYWLSGGMRPWSLAPGALLPLVRALDRALLRISPSLGSFVFIEIARKKGRA